MENVQHAALFSSLPFSTPLCPVRPTIHPPNGTGTLMYQMIGTWQREEEPVGVEAVERMPHPLHQYCSFTWWKLTLPNIFHHVIGRKDQIPWLDTPTLLPVQMMTQGLLNFSWSLWRRRRSLKALENGMCSWVQLSTRRSCLFSADKVRSKRTLKNTSSSWCNKISQIFKCTWKWFA